MFYRCFQQNGQIKWYRYGVAMDFSKGSSIGAPSRYFCNLPALEIKSTTSFDFNFHHSLLINRLVKNQ